MNRSREQKKAELLAEAETLIEPLLDWDERTSKPNLRQIEDAIRLSLEKQAIAALSAMAARSC